MRTEDYSESLVVHFRRAETLREKAIDLVSIDLDERQLFDLELLLNRGFYPLTGFMDKTTYESVVEKMILPDGTVWPLPVCLDVEDSLASKLSNGQQVALNDQEGFLLAILTVSDIWQPEKKDEARSVYGATDPSTHPGIRILYDTIKPWYVGGTIEGGNTPHTL